MNKTETVLLCRYVKAMCPAQAIDEYTPDAWADVLDDVTIGDAKDAIRHGIRDQGWRFIDVTDVVANVRRARHARLERYFRLHGHPVPPALYDDDPRAGTNWLNSAHRLIADGEVLSPEQLEGHRADPNLPSRDVILELGVVGREVPGA